MSDYVDKRDVLEMFSDLKEITAELHNVYDKLNNLPYLCDTPISCSRVNDLISRQNAIDFFIRLDKKFPHRVLSPERVRFILTRLPSAQMEIIRCKDCKWCEEHYDTDGNAPYWICKNWDSGTDADGFCHEAERRNE